MTTYIGIDNGVTGTIAILSGEKYSFGPTPAVIEQDYNKTQKRTRHVDVITIQKLLSMASVGVRTVVVLERPFKNPRMFNATVSGIDSFACTRTLLKLIGVPFVVVDSKDWQKPMLPHGTKGSANLKAASKDAGIRLFPEMKEEIERHGDADSLLMAEWARRQNL